MAKGQSYEREICKKLSYWWSSGKREDLFWRSQGSGARATSRSKRGKSTVGQYGDICSTDPISKPFTDIITVELKCGYNKVSVNDLLDLPSNTSTRVLEGWITKAERSKESAGSKTWMIIHRRDRRKALVYFPFIFSNIIQGLGNFTTIITKERAIGVVTLNRMLRVLSPQIIKEMMR